MVHVFVIAVVHGTKAQPGSTFDEREAVSVKNGDEKIDSVEGSYLFLV